MSRNIENFLHELFQKLLVQSTAQVHGNTGLSNQVHDFLVQRSQRIRVLQTKAKLSLTEYKRRLQHAWCRPLKFIYSEKATKFCEIFTLLLATVNTVKSKVKILQNFVAFSEYMNFKRSKQLEDPQLWVIAF